MFKKCRMLLLITLLFCAAEACAETRGFSLPVQRGSIEIHTTILSEDEEAEWLFLPSFADLFSLFPDAEETEEEGVWESNGLFIMQSANLRTLFLFSDDPVERGRAFIDASPHHRDETTGSMMLVNTEGTVDHLDRLRSLRGRGNSTWEQPKSPYQFKLESRADLLKTGAPSEMNRTWVLLADVYDPSLLRNRISLDMALELGISEASHSEHVDLYYDGEYRGTYLLAEKVELREGRIEEDGYQEIIDEWNKFAGIVNTDLLPSGQDTNRFGCDYHYVEGIPDTGIPTLGAYLLEMEGGNTLSDRSWFTLPDGSIIGCKNPDIASQSMMRYISERLTEARMTLAAGGVNPETGRTIEDDFDVDAFARAALLYELCYSDSGYRFSSSYFVLPAGETRFRPGSVWDFDLTWRYHRLGDNERGVGLKDQSGWLPDFYSVPAFREAVKRIYENEFCPIVEDIFLGEQQGRYLKPLSAYAEELRSAQRMNYKRWGQYEYIRCLYSTTFDGEVDLLRRFASERQEWLYDIFVTRSAEDTIHLTMLSYYAHAGDEPLIVPLPWQQAEILAAFSEEISEATEDEYAVYQTEILLTTQTPDPVFVLNGTPLNAEVQEDGSYRLLFTFEDISYRPVDYYDQDVGLVYDFDTYCRNYPHIAEALDYDPEAIMNYFFDEGIYEGQMGNAYFWPFLIRMNNGYLNEILGEDWDQYYWMFLEYGYYEGWQLATAAGFHPIVKDSL